MASRDEPQKESVCVRITPHPENDDQYTQESAHRSKRDSQEAQNGNSPSCVCHTIYSKLVFARQKQRKPRIDADVR